MNYSDKLPEGHVKLMQRIESTHSTPEFAWFDQTGKRVSPIFHDQESAMQFHNWTEVSIVKAAEDKK